MRLLTGAGTPRGFLARASARLGAILVPDGTLIAILFVAAEGQTAAIAVSLQADPLA